MNGTVRAACPARGEPIRAKRTIGDPARPVVAATLGAAGNERGTYGLGADDERLYLTYIDAIVPFQGIWSGIVAVTQAVT